MLDKFFGFMKIEDEVSVMETIIEHARIDDEELGLLNTMSEKICTGDFTEVESIYMKIRQINSDSLRIFENTADQIVNAGFDHQKQYDLLRIYQRHELISRYIIATAKRFVIMARLGKAMPKVLEDNFNTMMTEVLKIHKGLKTAFDQYLNDKKKVFDTIIMIEEIENHIDHIRADCLETIYRQANEGNLRMGDMRAIENAIEHLEEIADAVEETATSLEWLLI